MMAPLLIGSAAGLSIAGSCIGYATVHPRCQWFGPIRHAGNAGGSPRVALTFDDGPTPGQTERVIDILADFGVPATFFCIGQNAQANPDLLCNLHEAGHQIANHTYDHPRSGCFRGRSYWTKQIRRTNDIIMRTLGKEPRFFRPPMGLKTPHVLSAASSQRMTTVTWSHRGLDTWSQSAPRITQRLTRGLTTGSVLVLHDGSEPGRRRDIRPTLDALSAVIEQVRGQGYVFCRLGELLSVEAYASSSTEGSTTPSRRCSAPKQA